jgi:hypothetical protein
MALALVFYGGIGGVLLARYDRQLSASLNRTHRVAGDRRHLDAVVLAVAAATAGGLRLRELFLVSLT